MIKNTEVTLMRGYACGIVKATRLTRAHDEHHQTEPVLRVCLQGP